MAIDSRTCFDCTGLAEKPVNGTHSRREKEARGKSAVWREAAAAVVFLFWCAGGFVQISFEFRSHRPAFNEKTGEGEEEEERGASGTGWRSRRVGWMGVCSVIWRVSRHLSAVSIYVTTSASGSFDCGDLGRRGVVRVSCGLACALSAEEAIRRFVTTTTPAAEPWPAVATSWWVPPMRLPSNGHAVASRSVHSNVGLVRPALPCLALPCP